MPLAGAATSDRSCNFLHGINQIGHVGRALVPE